MTHFDNVLTENVAIGDYPLFYIECSTTTVSHLRTENNYHGDAIVKTVGDGATSGTNIHFDQSVIGSTKHAACFADLTGTTRYVQLTNIQHHSSQLSSCHIRLTSGTHYYPSVKNCFAANISEQNRIIALPGATHIPAADFSTLVLPSGDTTGAEDLAAIQGALNTYGAAQLINGTYYVNAAIAMNANEQSQFGQGNLTQIRHYTQV